MATPRVFAALLWAAAAYAAPLPRLLVVSNAPLYEGYRHTHELQAVQEKWDATPFLGTDVRMDLLYPPCDACNALNDTTDDLDAVIAALDSSAWDAAGVAGAMEGYFASVAGSRVMVVGVDVDLPPSVAAARPGTMFVELDIALDTGAGLAPKDGSSANHKVLTVSTAITEYLNGIVAGLMAVNKHEAIAMMYLASPAPDANATGGGDGGAPPPAPAPAAVAASAYFRQGVTDVAPEVCVYVSQVELAGFETFAARYREVHRIAFENYRDTDVIYIGDLGGYEEAVLAAATDISKSNYEVYAVSSGGRLPAASVLTGNADVHLSGIAFNWIPLFQALYRSGGGEAPRVSRSVYPTWADPMLKGTEMPARRACTLASSSLKSYGQLLSSAWMSAPYTTEGLPPLPPRPRLPGTCREDAPATPASGGGDAPPAPPADPPAWWRSTRQLSLRCFPQGTNLVRLVGVGMYLNSLGQVDLKSGTFSVDYNLYFHQWKTRFATYADADGMLVPSAMCTGGRPCMCPDIPENEWENYAGGENVLDTVNFVNADRLHVVRAVYKEEPDTAASKDPLLEHFRVQGNYVFRPTLQDWPLDSQRLSLELEDIVKKAQADIPVRFCHLANYSGLAPTGRYFPGMTIEPGSKVWEVNLGTSCWPSLRYPQDYENGVCKDGVDNPKEVLYPRAAVADADASCTCLGGSRAASRYTMTIGFERPKTLSLMKYFLPVAFITLVNSGVWFLYPRLFETRLGVCGSSLISEVMYHVSLTQNNPDTSVLTLADRLMITMYFNTLSAFMCVFGQAVLSQAGYDGLAWRFFRVTRIWGPINTLATISGVWVCSAIDEVLIYNIVAALITAVVTLVVIMPCVSRLASRVHYNLRRADVRSHKTTFVINESGAIVRSSSPEAANSVNTPFLRRDTTAELEEMSPNGTFDTRVESPPPE